MDQNIDAYRLYLLITQQIWYPEDRGENRQGYTRVPDVNGWDSVKKHRTLQFLVDRGLVEKEEDPGKPAWVCLTDKAPSRDGEIDLDEEPRFFLRFRSPEFTEDLQSKRNWTDTILLHLIWRQSVYYEGSGRRKGLIAERTAKPLTRKQFRTAIKRLAERGLVEYLTPQERKDHEEYLQRFKVKYPRVKTARGKGEYRKGTTAVSIPGSGFYDPTLFKRARTISEKGAHSSQKGRTNKEEGKEEGKEELSLRSPQSDVSPPKAAFHHREDNLKYEQDPVVSPDSSSGSLEDPYTEFPDSHPLSSPVNLPDSQNPSDKQPLSPGKKIPHTPGKMIDNPDFPDTLLSPNSPVESQLAIRFFGVSRIFVDPPMLTAWDSVLKELSTLIPRENGDNRVTEAISAVYSHMSQRFSRQKTGTPNWYLYTADLRETLRDYNRDLPAFTRWINTCSRLGFWKPSELTTPQVERMNLFYARTLVTRPKPPVLREIERIQENWESPEGPVEGSGLFYLKQYTRTGEELTELVASRFNGNAPPDYQERYHDLKEKEEEYWNLAGDARKYQRAVGSDGLFADLLRIREIAELSLETEEEDPEYLKHGVYLEDRVNRGYQFNLDSRGLSRALSYILDYPDAKVERVIELLNEGVI